MKHSIQIIIVLFSLALSSTAIGLPIGFVDQGSTTLDQNTGLEWLDVAVTLGRSFLDVQEELDSGVELGASRWRFATHKEFEDLANNFFGTSVSTSPYILCIAAENAGQIEWFDECGEDLSGSVTPDPFNSFVSLFGETGTQTVRGFLDFRTNFISPSNFEIYSDFAYVTAGDGISFSGEISTDWVEFDVCDSNVFSIQACAQKTFSFSSPNQGSFLVREALVPEPSALILLGLGLAGLVIRRRRKFN